MLCCHQISTQSLEAIVLIVAKSAGRISESCMHVNMQIQVGSVSCTLPAPHRPVPTSSHCSSLCYQGMGARITPPTPLFSHSTTLDNSESNSSNLQRLLVSSSPSPNDLRYPSLSFRLSTCSKTNLSAARSQNAPNLCSTYSRRLVTLFGDTSGCFGESSTPAGFLT